MCRKRWLVFFPFYLIHNPSRYSYLLQYDYKIILFFVIIFISVDCIYKS
nr:MAG TPA: hypothetical protein [Caudoviricetes sp.]DAG69178.1 MAG TPA: hypothetical protein [Caudoviricetes sp.]